MNDRAIGIYLMVLQVPMEKVHVKFLGGQESGSYERVTILFVQPCDRVLVGPVRAALPAVLLCGRYHHLRCRPTQLLRALPRVS